MRVLHLVPSLSGGGAERQLRYLVEALTARGHDVHVAYIHTTPRQPNRTWPGTLHHIPAVNNHDPRIITRVYRLIRSIQPEVVQTWMLQMDVAGGLAVMATNAVWILREPNIDVAYQKSWKFRLRELIARFSDAIVSNSGDGAAYWAKLHPNKVRVVRNGIPYYTIRSTPALPAATFGCNTAVPFVMYAGRLVSDHYSEKNLKRLLEAIKTAIEARRFNALIAGDGPQRHALEQLAAELEIQNNVFFTGHLQPEIVWGAMKSASAFVLVSPFEGMPNAVMEAVACGCPVVLSDIPPHRELLSDDMAIFVRHDDTASIAHGILECLGNPGTSARRAARALQAASRWSIEVMASEYEQIYAELVERRS